MMKYLDPLYWLGEDGYASVSDAVASQLFNGNIARILSAAFLIIGMWFVFRRKLTGTGLMFVSVSVLLIFGQSLLRSFGIEL